MRKLLLLIMLLNAASAAAQPLPQIIVPQWWETRGPARAVAPRIMPRASSAALSEARRYLCPHGGTPQGRGRCSRGAGIGAAGTGMGGGTGMMGDDPSVRDWDQGIAPPTRAQAPCPPGTTAMPARDQPNVTRCVAG